MAENTTNLSKIKREHLLEICSRIKNKEEVESFEINELEQFIRSMKYGLLFEEHEEQIDIKLKDNIPIFIEDVEKEIKTSTGHYNFLLEGDNLHSLKLLEKTHKNSVDVIYIDPPYNTGNKDFIYNDKIVGTDDGYRHSKWLSFMKERLIIAHDLLSNKGIIFISIDEHEYAQLKILCDDIFGEINYIDNFIWIKNSTKNLSKTTSTNHEYILCYAKDKSFVETQSFFRVTKQGYDEVQAILKEGTDNKWSFEKTEEKIKMYYKEHPELKGISQYKRVDYGPASSEQKCLKAYRLDNISAPKATGKASTYEVLHPRTSLPCKAPSRGWAFTRETMEAHIKNNLVYFYDSEENVPQFKRYLDTVTTDIVKSCFENFSEGKKDLNKIFGECPFENPKPVSLIKYLIKIVTENNKNAVILDFFAGSATTGHAVLELNQEDGGNRKFILCTNNENNICEEVTYQRLKTVIIGIRKDGSKYSDGLSANLKYFKAEMINQDNIDLDDELLDASIQLIELENFEDMNNENASIAIAENDEDLDNILNSLSSNLKKIYVANDVLLSGNQIQLLDIKGISLLSIPNHYYKEL